MLKTLSVMSCVLALSLVACGDDDDGDSGSAERTEQQAAAPAAEEQNGCKDVEQPTPRDGGRQKRPAGGLDSGKTYEVVLETSCGAFTIRLDQKKPAASLDSGKTYEVVLETSCGAFTIRLDQKTSPKAAASFAALARSGFFDDTIFHRIVPGFVIQGGDPTASGAGGPGYSTRDSVPRDAAYVPGVVAMAKAGNEPPGTAGSQFFVVTGADTGLTPDYALLGKVTKGMDVVQAIGELGDPASGGAGTPLQSVVIEGATVRER